MKEYPDLFWIQHKQQTHWILCSSTNDVVVEVWPDLSNKEWKIDKFRELFGDEFVEYKEPTQRKVYFTPNGRLYLRLGDARLDGYRENELETEDWGFK